MGEIIEEDKIEEELESDFEDIDSLVLSRNHSVSSMSEEEDRPDTISVRSIRSDRPKLPT